jgi:hypothetical protein
LLANRPFVTLLAARTISMLGLAFSPVALAFGVLQLPGADAATLSAVLAAQTAPMIVLMLVGGVVADRYPRRAVLLVGELCAATAWGSIGLMLLAALAGVASSLVYPALNGIIPDLVPALHRQQANTWLAMGASAARLAGLVAGGAVVVWLGGGWAMITAGAFYAVAGALILALPKVAGTLADASQSPLRQLRDGWGEFVSRQWLWVVVAQWSVMVMMLNASHGVLGPVVAETELGGAGAWTVVLAGEALGAVVGVALSLVWRPRRPIFTATLLTLTAGLPALLLGASAPLWTVAAAAFVLGISFDLFGVWWMTTMQNEVPAESLSRVASYDALGSLMFAPLGLLLAGPAALLVGPHVALVVTGVIAIATAGIALVSPDVRRLEAREHARAEVSQAA